MHSVLIRVTIQPNDTAATLKDRAKVIFKSYIEGTLTGMSWHEIQENEYVLFKMFFL